MTVLGLQLAGHSGSKTVKKHRASMLGAMLSGRHVNIKLHATGAFLVVRPGNIFRFMLAYLRGGGREFSEDAPTLRCLKFEAQFLRSMAYHPRTGASVQRGT